MVKNDSLALKSKLIKRLAKAPRQNTEKLTPVKDISVLTVGQSLKVNVGSSVMDATVLEIAKEGVRVQLPNGLAMNVRTEHLKVLIREANQSMNKLLNAAFAIGLALTGTSAVMADKTSHASHGDY